MVNVALSQLKPGMRLAKDVMLVDGSKSGPPVLKPYIIDLNERNDVEIAEIFV